MALRYLSDVVTLTIDPQRCNGCGRCVEVCPHGVFEMIERKSHMVDRDACMECGACQKNCPSQAVTVNSGVGCAMAVIQGALGGSSNCGCSIGPSCCE